MWLCVCLSVLHFVLKVLPLSFAKVISRLYETFCLSVSLYLALFGNSSHTKFIFARVISRVYVALCPSVSLYPALIAFCTFCTYSSPTELIFAKMIGCVYETFCLSVFLYLALCVSVLV